MTTSDLAIEKTAFITFYSFKGGVGRSMALVNVAGIMAGRGFRVLALDMDLEAPGISYLMRQEAHLADKQLPGVVDLLSDACNRGEEADLFALSPIEVVERYSYAYPLPDAIRLREGGLLRIMPAGQFDGHYQPRLDSLNLGQLYREGQGKPLIEAFKQVIAEAKMFDFVFIDSRTGFSDESGICTRDLADYLVVVMGLNRQNQAGTADFLRSLRVSKAVPKGIQIVLSPVPNGEDELVEEREKQAATTLSEAFGEKIELSLQIPYHPRLALTEEPHIFRRSKGYLYEAYAAIERAVLEMMGITSQALQKEVAKMAEAGRLDAVMHLLRHLERVDRGSQALASLSGNVLEKLVILPEASALRTHLVDKLASYPWAMNRLAVKLRDAGSLDAALFYEQLIKVAPNDADYLGNYANFLTSLAKDNESSEIYYKRALAVDPLNVNHLGNYANFLTTIREAHVAAEAHYKRTLRIDPKNASNLCNYANFLSDIRKDYDAAGAHYERALESEPENASILCNYAAFLSTDRGDHDAAEALFKRALEAAPKNTSTLGNYADFLTNIRKDHDAAEALFKRALEAAPKDANILGSYANFLTDVRRNYKDSEVYHKRLLEVAPDDANKLGNYAKLLFISKRSSNAISKIEEALMLEPLGLDLKCELHFYACAHAWEQFPESLATLKSLLVSGASSPNWPLEENVRVAKESGHPYPEFIAALAKVVSGKAKVVDLERFEVWQKGHF